MSNRIWNIYGRCPLVETKVRNEASDQFEKLHLRDFDTFERLFKGTRVKRRVEKLFDFRFKVRLFFDDENTVSLSRERILRRFVIFQSP